MLCSFFFLTDNIGFWHQKLLRPDNLSEISFLISRKRLTEWLIAADHPDDHSDDINDIIQSFLD